MYNVSENYTFTAMNNLANLSVPFFVMHLFINIVISQCQIHIPACCHQLKLFYIIVSFALQEGCPFIVCMTYAFQTPEKLCFILDLMNGGDLHYHLSQHGVFSEKEVRFYAAEVILGLEHMHNRYVVYRDLKVGKGYSCWLPWKIIDIVMTTHKFM